jgi:hypothetical protein
MKMGLPGMTTPFDLKISQAFDVKSLASGAKPSGSKPNETNVTDASEYWNCKDRGSVEHRSLLAACGIGAALWLSALAAGGGLLLVGGMYLNVVLAFSTAFERSVACAGRLALALAAAAGSLLALAGFGWFVAFDGSLELDEDDDDSLVGSRGCAGGGACSMGGGCGYHMQG